MGDVPELKPCPFCGCTECNIDDYYHAAGVSIRCPKCRFDFIRYWGDTPRTIADAWNTRADLPDACIADLQSNLREMTRLWSEAAAERDEARRRRDEWRKKAEGYDEVRLALREKVGAPWPPNMSRLMWAGIAADEKTRADDAEAKLAKAVDALERIAHASGIYGVEANAEDQGAGTLAYAHKSTCNLARATLAELKGTET